MPYKEINIQKLRDAVHQFQIHSAPASADSSAVCTVGDLKKVIGQLSDLLNVFIDELEN